jgi:hypothetical protein
MLAYLLYVGPAIPGYVGHLMSVNLLISLHTMYVGCSKLIVNSDCMEVIDTMLDGANSIGAAEALYKEC